MLLEKPIVVESCSGEISQDLASSSSSVTLKDTNPDRDNRAKIVFEKPIINEQFDEVNTNEKTLSDEIIVKSLRKRYQVRGKKILQHVRNHPDIISYDSHGILTIRGNIISGLNILDALPECFYENKHLNITGLDKWLLALNEIGVKHLITNKSLKNSEKEREALFCPESKWYFLGKLP